LDYDLEKKLKQSAGIEHRNFHGLMMVIIYPEVLQRCGLYVMFLLSELWYLWVCSTVFSCFILKVWTLKYIERFARLHSVWLLRLEYIYH